MSTKSQHALRYAKLPELLRSIREDADMTQRELGERLRKPQSWVFKSETGGRRVDLAEFCDWCQTCELDPHAGLKRFMRR